MKNTLEKSQKMKMMSMLTISRVVQLLEPVPVGKSSEEVLNGKSQGPGKLLLKVQTVRSALLLKGYWRLERGRGKLGMYCENGWGRKGFQRSMRLNSLLRRLVRDTTPLQRGIIRHLILILDLSQSMSEKDLRPTRYLLTLRYAQEFVVEFFEQNPISQLGVLGMRDGLAVRISNMSGNPTEHISAIQALRAQDPKGHPSLQNALEMARGALL